MNVAGQTPYSSAQSNPAGRCAWCLKEQGIPAGEGSHGICEKHAYLFRLQYQWNRLQAVPSYVERQIAAFAQESLEQTLAYYSFFDPTIHTAHLNLEQGVNASLILISS